MGANDVDAFVRLTTNIINTDNLKAGQFTRKINLHKTIGLLGNGLPYALGTNWLEKTSDIIQRGRKLTFDYLVCFI